MAALAPLIDEADLRAALDDLAAGRIAWAVFRNRVRARSELRSPRRPIIGKVAALDGSGSGSGSGTARCASKGRRRGLRPTRDLVADTRACAVGDESPPELH